MDSFSFGTFHISVKGKFFQRKSSNQFILIYLNIVTLQLNSLMLIDCVEIVRIGLVKHWEKARIQHIY